ncbi:hypothetical protein JCM10914A_43080 [Paenibacillus sp. JCM 10914]|uniref:hypothetical protein n=1 Tax=Paenibacillus sp. JCM 10914 TaxID=1236974 RepID=UPI0003CC73D1|nr:hypothetical protein [Paenibacillus sp. JCM 10914]GAE05527.1 hypothetical protein JCM10914_1631 [Paenibacillus sp. JCM 10914]
MLNQVWNTRWVKVLMIGSCMMVMAAGAAMAAPEDAEWVTIQIAAEDQALLNKQKEIDDYVAGAGKNEMAEQGFSVTHTGVVGDKVEVGITPYNESFADFLYQQLGEEEMLVVEGEQAVLLQATGATEDPVSSEDQRSAKQGEIDAYVAGEGKAEMEAEGFSVTHTGVVGDKVEVGITPFNEQHANFLYDKFGRDLVEVVEGEQAILYGAEAAVEPVAGTVPQSNAALWISIAAALAIIAGILIASRKRFIKK